MSRVPHTPDPSLPGCFPRNQLSSGAADGRTVGEAASERDIKQQLATHPAKSTPLQYSCPSASSSPVAGPTPGSSTNLDILIAETQRLIEDILIYKRTDFAYLFHQHNSDIAELPAFTRSLPGSLSDFDSLSEYYDTRRKALKLSITFDPATDQITISPRFAMSQRETALHQSVSDWAFYVLLSMLQGPKPFLALEQLLLLKSGGSEAQLPTNMYVEVGEGGDQRKEADDGCKIPDQSYWVNGMLFPSVVFETGWTETMEDLQRDARQWLARTHHFSEVGEAEKGVRVVILTKIWEVKGEELKEMEKNRKKVLERIDDGDIMLEEDLDLLKAVEEDESLQRNFAAMNAGATRAEDDQNNIDGADDSFDENEIDNEDDYFDQDPDATFASNTESTPERWSSARAKIDVDSWVGTIHCVLHVWRWNSRTNAPGCASKHVVLPRQADGRNQNRRQLVLWKRDIFPEALDGEKKFVLDLNELRDRLDQARKQYAFQRLLGWRDMYLQRKHGCEGREEYRQRVLR